ncbi:helix-turn-helix domain-containing protein [Mycobacterium simiae]|uniref:AraC-like ligand-binding domain-containing protein n=1 Tax=Mycobacterium simiae TaxID=1784 RepID=UPI00263A0EB1|nr:helix-turn-helix domain-containing protein [Mycobacterium simiae]
MPDSSTDRRCAALRVGINGHAPRVPTEVEFEAFEAFLSEQLGPMQLLPDDVETFRGQIRSVDLGVVQLSKVQCGNAFVARRTKQLVAASSSRCLKVGMQVSGGCLLSQGGRQATLGPGDFAIYDTGRPYEISGDAAFHMEAVMFPREALQLPQSVLERLAIRRISGREGVGQLVSRYLRTLARQADDGVNSGSFYLADATLNLLAASFVEQLDDGTTMPSDGKKALLLRIRNYIEQRLSDPALDLTSIAAAHHISIRMLHKLFENEDLTVAEWIRVRRLGHCRQDLANPALAQQQVSSIAAKWGLTDPAHFSRLFKATYGLSPTDYRAAVQLKRLVPNT